MGHERSYGRCGRMSALPPLATVIATSRAASEVQILTKELCCIFPLAVPFRIHDASDKGAIRRHEIRLFHTERQPLPQQSAFARAVPGRDTRPSRKWRREKSDSTLRS